MQLPDLKLDTIIKHIQDHGFESLDPHAQVQANEILQDHVERECFEEVAANPLYWKQNGDGLLVAANLIRITHLTNWGLSAEDVRNGGFDAAAERTKHQMRRIYMLLAGLAIENYAKGVIMTAAAKNHVKNGKISGLKSHDCLDLARRAKVCLSKSEEATLVCLSAHIEWYGRYPTRNEYKGRHGGVRSRTPEDYANVDEVAKKLLALIKR